MRYAPTEQKVVDVRTVYLGLAAQDEPGVRRTGPEPDQVIPLPGN